MCRIAVMCFFSKTFDLKNVQFEFHKLYVIIALTYSTAATASEKVNAMITSTHNLTLSSLR